MPGIPAFRRQKQEDCCKFKANQSYIVSSRACWTGCIVRPCLDQASQGWRHITVVPSLGRLKEDWESRVIFSFRESLRPGCTTSNSNSIKQATNQPDRKIKRLVATSLNTPSLYDTCIPLAMLFSSLFLCDLMTSFKQRRHFFCTGCLLTFSLMQFSLLSLDSLYIPSSATWAPHRAPSFFSYLLTADYMCCESLASWDGLQTTYWMISRWWFITLWYYL